MKWRRLDDTAAPTYVLVADPGDDAFQELTRFARDQHIAAAELTGLGAFSRAIVGWFDRDKKDYKRIAIEEQCEVLSLVGDIALGDDTPQVHAHVVVGLSDGSVRGGHLLSGQVWPTLEVIVKESPAQLRKTSRPEIGLALIDLGATSQ